MKKNMGYVDRFIRIILAAVIVYLSTTGKIHGVLNIVLVVLAVIFLLTSAIGFCPLYLPFKISTNKKKAA